MTADLARQKVEATRRVYDAAHRANTAAAIAQARWPGVAGEVLAEKCREVHDFPWLVANPQSRTTRLIEELLAMDELEETA